MPQGALVIVVVTQPHDLGLFLMMSATNSYLCASRNYYQFQIFRTFVTSYCTYNSMLILCSHCLLILSGICYWYLE